MIEQRTTKAVTKGSPFPLGATLTSDGVNFAIYSKHGAEVFLLLFDAPDGKPTDIIHLQERDKFIWHAKVKRVESGATLRLQGLRRVSPRVGITLQRLKAAPRSLRQGGRREVPQRRQPACSPTIPSPAREIDLSTRATTRPSCPRGSSSTTPSTGRASLAGPRAGTARHLRGARQRIHGAPFLRRRLSGDLPRVHREDPAPDPARRQCGGTPARPRVLRRRLPD